jgi:hypothetical protein
VVVTDQPVELLIGNDCRGEREKREWIGEHNVDVVVRRVVERVFVW